MRAGRPRSRDLGVSPEGGPGGPDGIVEQPVRRWVKGGGRPEAWRVAIPDGCRGAIVCRDQGGAARVTGGVARTARLARTDQFPDGGSQQSPGSRSAPREGKALTARLPR